MAVPLTSIVDFPGLLMDGVIPETRMQTNTELSRVDNVFGDRYPVCSCAGMENYT